jgi:hypothetical protein
LEFDFGQGMIGYILGDKLDNYNITDGNQRFTYLDMHVIWAAIPRPFTKERKRMSARYQYHSLGKLIALDNIFIALVCCIIIVWTFVFDSLRLVQQKEASLLPY